VASLLTGKQLAVLMAIDAGAGGVAPLLALSVSTIFQ